MRKAIAIFFTFIYLFNLAGYKLIFDYLIEKSDTQKIIQIDNEEYNESTLLEIKVPLTLPYPVNWNEYERFDGEIEVNGVQYNFVKRKWNHDTLYVMCLPNDTKTELYKAKNNYPLRDIAGKSNTPQKKDANSNQKKNNSEPVYSQYGLFELKQTTNDIDTYSSLIPPPLPISFFTSCFRPPKANA